MTYSRVTIQLLMKCQRLIQQEFSTRIKLDDEQIVTMILAYAAQTSSEELKTCASAVSRQFLIDQNTQPQLEKSQTTARVYRGQVIEDSKPATSNEAKPSAQMKTIIYRGQKVQVAR